MTESEWLECNDSVQMLEFLRDRTSDRKLRLSAIACCQGMNLFGVDCRTLEAIQVAERMADGTADIQQQDAAYDAAFEAAEDALQECSAARRRLPSDSSEVAKLRLAASLAEMGEWVLADGWGAAEQAAYLNWVGVTQSKEPRTK